MRTTRSYHAMSLLYSGTGALALDVFVSCLSLALVQLASALPTPFRSTFIPSEGLGKNIQHLPCVSKVTGEAGICMFAKTCKDANGTLVGTCLDSFYVGTCCRVEPAATLDLQIPPVETLAGANPLEEVNHPSMRPLPSIQTTPTETTASIFSKLRTRPTTLSTLSISSAETTAAITPFTTTSSMLMVSSTSRSASVTSSMMASSMMAGTTDMPSIVSSQRAKLPAPFARKASQSSPTFIQTPNPNPMNVIESEVDEQLNSLNMSDYKQVCGRRLVPKSRIVGGQNAGFGKWPWQISLIYEHSQRCGASLLSKNWAITAAHCVYNISAANLMLRLGEYDLSTNSEPYGYEELGVELIVEHCMFNIETLENDLAMLRFYEPVTFQPNILPICVPDDSTDFVGETAHITGWGETEEDGPLASVLQEVSVPIISNSECEDMYRDNGYIEHLPKKIICAGWKNGGFDSCKGDSGGPMVIQRSSDSRWIQIGVISWGIKCAAPNKPGVYTRLSEFRDWINKNLES